MLTHRRRPDSVIKAILDQCEPRGPWILPMQVQAYL